MSRVAKPITDGRNAHTFQIRFSAEEWNRLMEDVEEYRRDTGLRSLSTSDYIILMLGLSRRRNDG